MGRKENIDIEKFDQQFRYDKDDLGAVCSQDGTGFKVWSPRAKSVRLRLFQDGMTDCFESRELVPDGRGTWKYETPQNLHGT